MEEIPETPYSVSILILHILILHHEIIQALHSSSSYAIRSVVPYSPSVLDSLSLRIPLKTVVVSSPGLASCFPSLSGLGAPLTAYSLCSSPRAPSVLA